MCPQNLTYVFHHAVSYTPSDCQLECGAQAVLPSYPPQHIQHIPLNEHCRMILSKDDGPAYEVHPL